MIRKRQRDPSPTLSSSTFESPNAKKQRTLGPEAWDGVMRWVKMGRLTAGSGQEDGDEDERDFENDSDDYEDFGEARQDGEDEDEERGRQGAYAPVNTLLRDLHQAHTRRISADKLAPPLSNPPSASSSRNPNQSDPFISHRADHAMSSSAPSSPEKSGKWRAADRRVRFEEDEEVDAEVAEEERRSSAVVDKETQAVRGRYEDMNRLLGSLVLSRRTNHESS